MHRRHVRPKQPSCREPLSWTKLSLDFVAGIPNGVPPALSSPFLMDLALSAGSLIRHRDSEGPDPKGPYLEIAPPEADSYLPRFSVFERVPIAHNVILKLPAPVEIAASKVPFADRIDRIKDLQDIKFIQEKFQIKNLVFTDPSRY